MNVTDITRSLPPRSTENAYRGIHPDAVQIATVNKLKHQHLLSNDPLTAGNDLHHLLRRMSDSDPLSPTESAYFPWVSAMRRMVWALGAWQMDIDAPLKACRNVPNGTCDLLVHGGPKKRGVLEVKVIVRGTQETPRARDIVQLASYCLLLAGAGSFDALWAGVVYMELETRLVRLLVFKNARPIIEPALELFSAA